MNILLVEYFTGGGLCGIKSPKDLPEDLCREGDLMLHALARDLGQIPGVRLTITRDRRLPAPDLTGVDVRTIAEDEDWEPHLRKLLSATDACWPIAPETGDMLAELCELCEQSGCLLLNSSTAAVRCAASKRLTAERLLAAELPGVPTWGRDDWREHVGEGERIVIKPDDGVGCEDVRISDAAHAAPREGDVVQPYIEGEAASLNVLYDGDECHLAGVNLQEIESDGGNLSLKACIVNGLRHTAYDFEGMAKQIGQAIPGLAGHVGIDCVVRDDDVRIIEINPRLTTSYVGLHESLGVNPAACVLSLLMRSPTRWPTHWPIQSPPSRFDIRSATAVRIEL